MGRRKRGDYIKPKTEWTNQHNQEIDTENRLVSHLGKNWDESDVFYIPLEDLNWKWSEQHVKDLIELWKDGRTLDEMTRFLKRDDRDEVAVMIMDLKRKGRIKQRPNGVFGCSAQ